MFLAMVIWVVAMILGGIIAAQKGRSVVGWVLLGGLIPISILILLVLPSKKKPAEAASKASPDELKICPKCAERIQKAAVVCRFCNYEFSAPSKPDTRPCPHCKKEMTSSESWCGSCGQFSPPPITQAEKI